MFSIIVILNNYLGERNDIRQPIAGYQYLRYDCWYSEFINGYFRTTGLFLPFTIVHGNVHIIVYFLERFAIIWIITSVYI